MITELTVQGTVNTELFVQTLVVLQMIRSNTNCVWETYWKTLLFKHIVGVATAAYFSWLHRKVKSLHITVLSSCSVNFMCLTCCLLGVAILMANSIKNIHRYKKNSWCSKSLYMHNRKFQNQKIKMHDTLRGFNK